MAISDFATVKFENGALYFLDQTLLPNEERYVEMQTVEDVYDAIKRLVVRGAPAIGVGAAYGMWLAARNYAVENGLLGGAAVSAALSPEQVEAWLEAFRRDGAYLKSSRPTAVNLEWAVERMDGRMIAMKAMADEVAAGKFGVLQINADYILNELMQEADNIRVEDENSCYMMGMFGLTLLEPGMGLLTHCNAGALATAGYGTALAPIHMGQERGYDFHVYADETRPLLQGARLTAWELSRNGVDVTLICDNMASTVMKQGKIDAVLVGCDRMAANGDGANKIGTSGVAILAKEYGIPFYMFVPTSTIDMSIKSGNDIVIEERDPEEISEMWYARRMAPEGIRSFNPAFDVTDHKYITAIVTERGIALPPFDESLSALMDV
ncbi:MAG: S-methyl-5-thioribose-1-phosphate isomerase [Mogibacterium sp.]|nr:S-methyl-5-thioribose-1-phosphate isomerase [Mogibacterium sp.]